MPTRTDGNLNFNTFSIFLGWSKDFICIIKLCFYLRKINPWRIVSIKLWIVVVDVFDFEINVFARIAIVALTLAAVYTYLALELGDIFALQNEKCKIYLSKEQRI